jgi:hypothetical protein
VMHLELGAEVPRRRLSPAALGLFVVFGLAAYGGANILGFEALSDRVWFGSNQPKESALASVSGWTTTNSVATVARNLMLDIVMSETPQDLPAIEEAIEGLAVASPTSTAIWEGLAEIRKARGESMESVLAAFRMSALTGSHEGYFMMQRAMFGLKHWNELPEQDRSTVARDMLLSIGPADGRPLARYREILATKPAAERDSIRSALFASGLASSRVLEALGV